MELIQSGPIRARRAISVNEGLSTKGRRPSPRWRDRSLFWPSTAGITYFVGTSAVATAEYFSEMSKLSRGFSSWPDTPHMFVQFLTVPMSFFISVQPGYPEDFDVGRWKTALHDGRGTIAALVVMQTVLIVVVVAFLIHRARRKSGPAVKPASPVG